MTQQFPKLASIPFELGSLVGRLGPRDEAIALLSRVVEMEPRHPVAWRVLGNQLAENSDSKGAARAYSRHMKQFVRELKLLEDAVDGGIDELSKAERMLRQSLSVNPTDAPAIQLLARVLIRLGRNPEAQVLIDIILKDTPGATLFETQKATNLVMLGEYDEGLALFDRLRIRAADNSVFWLHYGHAMRIVGRNADAIEAYRKGVELDPGYGTAWWALANLKTYRFSPAEYSSSAKILATASAVSWNLRSVRRLKITRRTRTPLSIIAGPTRSDAPTSATMRTRHTKA